VVKSGDTLSGIAKKQGLESKTLRDYNPQIKDENKIYVGQKLTLKPTTVTVQKGDTLSRLADRFDVGTNDLFQANAGSIQNRNRIYPGQQLRLPSSPAQVTTPPARPTPTPQQTRPTPTPQQTRPSPTPQQTRPSSAPSTPTTSGVSKTTAGFKTVDLKDFLSVDKGTQSLAAIVIGNAEGTRTPTGGKTPAFGGHEDPGNKKNNSGSFSYQVAPVRSPQEADLRQLQAMNGQLGRYTQTVKKAGLDPSNALLASAYFDSYNQSPAAAGRLLKQLPYLKENGITPQTITEARVRSWVNPETGSRYTGSDGKPYGSFFADKARQNLGLGPNAPVPDKAILQAVQADQGRRVGEMVKALQQQGLGPTTASSRPATNPTPAAPAKPTTSTPAKPTTSTPAKPTTSTPAKPTVTGGPFTSLAAAKASGTYIDQMAGDPSGSNSNCGFTSGLMALKILGVKLPKVDSSFKGASVGYQQAMQLRQLSGAPLGDGAISRPEHVKQALNKTPGARAETLKNTWGDNKLGATEAMRKAFLNPNQQEVFVVAGNPSLGWKDESEFPNPKGLNDHWIAVTGYDAKKGTFIVMDPYVKSNAPIQVTPQALAAYLSWGNAEKNEVISVTRR
jgi:LysM repeat protein